MIELKELDPKISVLVEKNYKTNREDDIDRFMDRRYKAATKRQDFINAMLLKRLYPLLAVIVALAFVFNSIFHFTSF